SYYNLNKELQKEFEFNFINPFFLETISSTSPIYLPENIVDLENVGNGINVPPHIYFNLFLNIANYYGLPLLIQNQPGETSVSEGNRRGRGRGNRSRGRGNRRGGQQGRGNRRGGQQGRGNRRGGQQGRGRGN
ncbi:hypothetical protein Mgra_00006571, partial [Meloidogyne graminicola]